ncbi:hypothetical protein, partial [Nocardia vaccinii]|uniref:hypothetical protein n=1 Tax=Nocardia vaccinii TaxID=1822 RepID=UPI001C3F5A33
MQLITLQLITLAAIFAPSRSAKLHRGPRNACLGNGGMQFRGMGDWTFNAEETRPGCAEWIVL